MDRVYNFSAGPAVLPEEVLREAADEMLNYRGSGMSVMEMSQKQKQIFAIFSIFPTTIRCFSCRAAPGPSLRQFP